jgi:putative ABC transport system permease protein
MNDASKEIPLSKKMFRALMRLLPQDFRADFGGEMEHVFENQRREAQGRGGVARLWWETLAGIFRTAPREHMEILRQDCGYAFRMMRKNAGFTAIAVLTLALGIGANTAIFSVVRAVLLRPLPYPHGDQLVFVRQQALKEGIEDTTFSDHEMHDYREQNQSLAALVEYHAMSFTLFGHGDPDRVRTGVVSWNYFDVFGVQPILGRKFFPADEKPGAAPVLLLSYEYWKNNFGGDAKIVGQTFEMNDKVHTVVGVLPPMPQYPHENDVYMPSSACPFRAAESFIQNRSARMMEAFGKLKPGVTLAAAKADLSTIAGRLESQYPETYPENIGYAATATALQDELAKKARTTLLVLLAAAGFVLLIACANVANLTLARMSRRERELALRTALGAGRSRLLRQLLTESFLIAAIGGLLGLFLAYDSVPLLAEYAARLTPRAREIRVDWGVLLFALGMTVGMTIVFGTFSAMVSRGDVTSNLKEGGAGSGVGRHQNRVRNTLIVSQVAFSFLLLIGGGLVLRSFLKMQEVDPGFVPHRVLALKINFNWSKYSTGEKLWEIEKKLLERVEAEPGVISAALSSSYPLEADLIAAGLAANSNNFVIQGRTMRPGEAALVASFETASPEYLKTLGIPLREGRMIVATDDPEAPAVAVLNETARRQLFPNENAIGKKVSLDKGKKWIEIVGVMGDVRDFGLTQPPAARIYLSEAQFPQSGDLMVRTAADPQMMAAGIKKAIHEVDSQTAVTRVMTLEQARSDSMASPRVTASLLGLFAGLALLIATAGIGGIMALTVSQRVHEIGIRMALGAEPAAILKMVLGQGLSLVLLGGAIGFAGALALKGLVKSFLFGVTPNDPVTFATVALLLAGAALVASYVPARRAAAVDPMHVLRME